MYIFAIGAAAMGAYLLWLARASLRRSAILASAGLWLLYAIYEYFVASGALCDAKCNIRVDLLLFWPLLLLATLNAFYGGYGKLFGGALLVVTAVMLAAFV